MPGKRVTGMLKQWADPSPSDFLRWEALVLAGADPSQAAQELGFKGSLTFRRTDAARHGEVLDVWRERINAADRRTARETLREIATKPEAPDAARVSAAATLGRFAGMGEADRLEISGPNGSPLEMIVGAAERLREKLAPLVDDAGETQAVPADR